MKTLIALTGVTGAMGSEALLALLQSDLDIHIRAIVFQQEHTPSSLKKLQKKNPERFSFFRGDISNLEDCKRLLADADYCLHCAAIIPPKADHAPEQTYRSNFLGTKNLIDAVLEQGNHTKFINISTVALYGNRAYPHNWGRVGDPLISSDYDHYSMNKMKAERYLLDSGLQSFVSLRQTGILHKKMFTNNMKDGLLFHTAWNCCLEWTTDLESAHLCKQLIAKDLQGDLQGFWNRCYNIGGGELSRKTGYEVLNDGFHMLGRETKDFFKPNWNAHRNFHGTWYTDSEELENFLQFRGDSYADYWQRMSKKYWYFSLGKLLPPSWISAFVFKRLFKNTNAPMYWVKHKKMGRVKAFYGGMENFHKIGEDWSTYDLLHTHADQKEMRTVAYAKEHGQLLNHGFDDQKADSQLTLEDLQSASKFRGGECLEENFVPGDVYRKLRWRCHEGHTFEGTAYTILRGGHWCPTCAEPMPWQYGKLAQHSPYFAQVYYDTHSKEEENDVYPIAGEDDSFIEIS